LCVCLWSDGVSISVKARYNLFEKDKMKRATQKEFEKLIKKEIVSRK
jgi:hypothetical protein